MGSICRPPVEYHLFTLKFKEKPWKNSMTEPIVSQSWIYWVNRITAAFFDFYFASCSCYRFLSLKTDFVEN